MPHAMPHAIDVSLLDHRSRLEQVGTIALFGVVGALQFSIAAAQILLTVAIVCWFLLVVLERERLAVPHFFWPLAAYAAVTLVSAAFSPAPRVSLLPCKQMVL